MWSSQQHLGTCTKLFSLLVLLFVSQLADCMFSWEVISWLGGEFCFPPKHGADLFKLEAEMKKDRSHAYDCTLGGLQSPVFCPCFWTDTWHMGKACWNPVCMILYVFTSCFTQLTLINQWALRSGFLVKGRVIKSPNAVRNLACILLPGLRCCVPSAASEHLPQGLHKPEAFQGWGLWTMRHTFSTLARRLLCFAFCG